MERPFPVMCRVAERCLSLENVTDFFIFPNDMPVDAITDFSILTSLALVHAGSEGKTREQIENTLGLHSSFIDRVDGAIGALNDVISGTHLDPVLAVFSQSGFAYDDTFVKTAQADYGTSPQLVRITVSLSPLSDDSFVSLGVCITLHIPSLGL